jgi:hypothetical protein
MRYTFQSLQQHNFKSILIHSIYKLLWPLGLILLVYFLYPQSRFVKDNWHVYSFLFIEVFNLLRVFTTDSINEIILDQSKNRIEIAYYNIYQGNVEEKVSFADMSVNIETAYKGGIKQIVFYIKKRADVIIKKDKYNFSHVDIESLSELLYSVTSPKKN